LKTFSAVFDGDPIDERAYIETAVESTGADTTYTNPTSHEFIGELRDFVWHQEEPIVSTGPYAQWCVMRSAREQVTV
ncbi:asparagine synthase C-terminal domain-containing protein, partial [Klebsiella pneumoniae]|nr:asparagine synthase C-terminal domain-containing protein [Klebsiella pneumoniae]